MIFTGFCCFSACFALLSEKAWFRVARAFRPCRKCAVSYRGAFRRTPKMCGIMQRRFFVRTPQVRCFPQRCFFLCVSKMCRLLQEFFAQRTPAVNTPVFLQERASFVFGRKKDPPRFPETGKRGGFVYKMFDFFRKPAFSVRGTVRKCARITLFPCRLQIP